MSSSGTPCNRKMKWNRQEHIVTMRKANISVYKNIKMKKVPYRTIQQDLNKSTQENYLHQNKVLNYGIKKDEQFRLQETHHIARWRPYALKKERCGGGLGLDGCDSLSYRKPTLHRGQWCCSDDWRTSWVTCNFLFLVFLV